MESPEHSAENYAHASPDDIEKRFDVSPTPVALLRAHGAMRRLGYAEEPIVPHMETTRAIRDHSSFAVKARQRRYQLVYGNARHLGGKRDDSRGGVACPN